jgi:copper chaperone CopZ
MQRVRSTLNGIEGVLKHDVNPTERTLIVTFDDRVTTVEKILGQLGEAGYSISGIPQIIL